MLSPNSDSTRQPTRIFKILASMLMLGIAMQLAQAAGPARAQGAGDGPLGVHGTDGADALDAAVGPGGVGAGLVHWVRADEGVFQDTGTTPSGEGDPVAQWNDQSASALHLSQGTAGQQPTYRAGAANSNFNPALEFDNDFLNNTNRIVQTTDSLSMIAVGATDVTGGINTLYAFGDNYNDPTMDQEAARISPFMDGSSPSNVDLFNGELPQDEPMIWSLRAENGVADDLRFAFQGEELATNMEIPNTANYGQNVGVGSDGGGEDWDHLIMEAIAFDRKLTIGELQRVNSYLAIKYGVTLRTVDNDASIVEGDYIDAAGNTVWDSTVNATYHNDVAGIGRDDDSGLDQRKSRSVHADSMVTMKKSGSFLTDGSFLIWGNDDGAMAFSQAYVPNSFTPVTDYARMDRIWRVQESGSIASVTLSIPFCIGATHLLVHGSADFDSGTPLELPLSVDGDGNLSVSVNLADGQYFSFARAAVAPGGVSADLQLWVLADYGACAAEGGAVNTWLDQSGNGNDMTAQTAAREPTYQGPMPDANFHPTLLFDGANDGLEIAPFMTGAEPGGSVFSAASNESPGSGFDNLVVFGIDNPHLGTAAATGQPLGYMNGSSPIRNDHPTDPVPGQSHIWSWEWDMASEPSSLVSNTGLDVIFDGEVSTAANMEVRESQFANGAPAADEFQIGSYEGIEPWDGPIGEVAVYDRNLSAAESQRVNSYFSLRWGTTLDIDPASDTVNYDYVDASGSTIWPGTADAGYQDYHHDVAGIGRDDRSGLDQRIARSVNADSLATIEAQSAFAADQDFMLWGNDDGSTSFSNPYTPNSFTPPAPMARMGRIWRVEETGSVGTVEVSLPVGTSAEYLLVHNIADFDSGSPTEIPLVEDDDGAPSALVDLADGQYFSFARVGYAPGGVLTNLELWMKADQGVPALLGSQVDTWLDQSGNGNDMTAQTAAREPLYQWPEAGTNFHPTLLFDGINSGLELAPFMTGAEPGGSVYGSAANESPGTGFDNLVVFGIDNPHLGKAPGGAPLGYMNGSSPIRADHPTDPVADQTHLWGWEWDMANEPSSILSNTGLDVIFDGEPFTGPDMELREAHFANGAPDADQFQIGSYEAVEVWDGPIGEIAVYNRNLTAVESQRVSSYFALRWAATLDMDPASATTNFDYADSSGTTIWPGTSDASYQGFHHDVAGIGRDDPADLMQRQSTSASLDRLVAIGLGTLADSNDDNPNDFSADGSFLLWGNDDGSTVITSTVAGAPNVSRIQRLWKVAETGTVGQVRVGIDPSGLTLGATDLGWLIVSDDATIDGGDAFFPLGDQGDYLAADVDLQDGQVLAFAVQTQVDTDGDGVPDVDDDDDDNDGLPDLLEGDGTLDTDGDGVPDSRDLDSDNDGINDVVEIDGPDADGDGMVDCLGPVVPGALSVAISSTSGDIDISDLGQQGQPGFTDFRIGALESTDIRVFEEQSLVLDSALDVDYFVPAGGGTAAGSSPFKIPAGTTIKSFLVHWDPPGGAGGTTGSITFDTPIHALILRWHDLNPADRLDVGDNVYYRGGVRGSTEFDSQVISPDGMSITIDDFVLGYVDELRVIFVDPSPQPNPLDVDGDGVLDCFDASEGGTPLTAVDSDGDGVPDLRDLDSDNDSISDLVEGGSGGLDADDDGVIDGPDSDGDGIQDSVDGLAGFGDAGSPPAPDLDDDGDGDWRDVDSDGDATLDIDEAGNGDLDLDDDGRVDDTDDLDGDGISDAVDLDPTEFGHIGVPAALAAIDTDGDGVPDVTDPDDDNDGILDTIEGYDDADGDGIPNARDLDSDNDGINDVIEGGVRDCDFDEVLEDTDADNDGVADGADADGDGLVASVDPDEGGCDALVPDSDGDGTPDFLDLDSDNDSVSDLIEGGSGADDADNDGVADGPDADGDGIVDSADDNDASYGEDSDTPPTNTDGDALPDYLDPDSDDPGDTTGDGSGDDIDDVGNGSLDANGDGLLDDATDDDGDGAANVVDDDDTVFGGIGDPFADADGDGISDAAEGAGAVDTDGDGEPDSEDLDSDGDGIPDAEEGAEDADGDGIPNFRDLDADNDGINDVIEGGGTDVDGDGQQDGTDGDGNGLVDTVDPAEGGTPLPVPDSDGDGADDYLDLDSDNDTISDLVEGGSGATDADDDGVADGPDADGDGIVDSADDNDALFGEDSDTPPANSDGDALDDYLDPDSDDPGDTTGDGTGDDIDDAGNGPLDGDGDGQIDDATDDDGDGAANPVDEDDAVFGGLADPFGDADGDGISNADEGNGNVDTDGDGVPDSEDLDSDGDGIPDAEEGTDDPDGDGIPNYRDLDSDNDGINDVFEGGGTDLDGDGQQDGTDGDGNGLVDTVDPAEGGTPLPVPDTDGDGADDYVDLDSDNDTISDLVEGGSGATDADDDGVADGPDADGDGIVDSADDNDALFGEDADAPPTNADGDSRPDYRDADSNDPGDINGNGTGDDIDDAGNGPLDANGDGEIDDATDDDGDGAANPVDDDDAVFGGLADPFGDADGDGISNAEEGNGNVDTDGDGQPDSEDLDSDGDGIPDAEEGTDDADNDGIPNFRDLDSDNDGINDVIEGGGLDADGDAQQDGADGDGNGLVDTVDPAEGGTPLPVPDTDGDGADDYLDLDSDNDSVSDLIEGGSGAIDANDNGVADGPDADGDGIVNSADDNDALFGEDSDPGAQNTDGDALDDYLDPDSDDPGDTTGDGTGDDIDDAGNSGLDADDDGELDDPTDDDGDGAANDVDDNDALFGGIGDPFGDADGDGISDAAEGNGAVDTDGDGEPDSEDLDSDGDGIPDAEEGAEDADGDGIPNYRDLDADNDGINDVIEGGGTDVDGDGLQDGTDGDGNGLVDTVDPAEGGTPLPVPDSDGDGADDYLDLDSDNDTISDLVEGGSGATDADDDGVADGPDADGDGIVDSTDDNDALFGEDSDTPPANSDGDALDDYLDPDSDDPGDTTGDGTGDDIDDAGNGPLDGNGDGQIDDATDDDGDGAANPVDEDDANFGGLADPFGDADGDGISNADEGNGNVDTDGDGVPDSEDLDSDGDGIPDAEEGTEDADGDGIPNYRDLDSDNDGINDVFEGGGTDLDGDGQQDGTDGDGNGLVDTVDPAEGGTPLPVPDSDGDGADDYVDLDSDNDTISDLVEGGSGATDADDDGVADGPDADGDGIVDSADDNDASFGEDSDAPPTNTDGDALDDYLDPDSDDPGDTTGDGTGDDIDDAGNGALDGDGDGDIDDPTDDDGDGAANDIDDDDANFGGIPNPFGDADGDGISDADEGNGAVDTDGDGQPDSDDLDSDGDGIPDAEEGNVDTDGDGIPNFRDLDSDNDGINDVIEGGGTDVDGDGQQDGTDGDGNGLVDTIDPAEGGTPLPVPDSDGDGAEDYVDLDSDNDTVSDLVEGGSGATDADDDGVADGPDADGDGIVDSADDNDALFGEDADDAPTNTDGDALPNYLDPDSNDPSDTTGDGDGDDIDDAGNGGLDADGDGDIDDATDDDGDGAANGVDEDDANFGGLPAGLDSDGDGVPDAIDLDDDNDGLPDAEEGDGDRDRDGIPNRLDDDSDGDGIFDSIEAGHGLDTNADGDLDAGEAGGFGANGLADDVETSPDSGILAQPPADADADTVIDALEPDHRDTDGDGLIDPLDPDDDGDGTDDGNPSQDTDDEVGDPQDPTDTDGDGIPDYLDADTGDGSGDDVTGSGDGDGDGLSDAEECPDGVCRDSDGDLVPDYMDADDDGDGIPTLDEGSGDADGDGKADHLDIDADDDGAIDLVEAFNAGGGGFFVLSAVQIQERLQQGGGGDTDSDGIPDQVDIDSDDDGIPDNIELQSTLGYIPPTGNDTDNDGLDDAYDPDCTGANCGGTVGVPITPENTDGVGQPDYLDLDSDEDGTDDRTEGDRGIFAPGSDLDGDGLNDGFDNVFGPDVNDDIDDPATDLPDTDGDVLSGGDLDYRDDINNIGLSLGGRVFRDLDDDGQINGTDSGVGAVLLRLLADTDASGDLTPGDVEIDVQSTAGGGFYRFEGLAEGDYIVQVDPINFDPAGPLVSLHSSTGNDIAGAAPDPDDDVVGDDNGDEVAGLGVASLAITLSDGGEPPVGVDGDDTLGNQTLDFGFTCDLSIGDQVFMDLDNDGVYEPGDGEYGLSFVDVNLYEDTDLSGDLSAPDTLVDSTQTGPGGLYLFDGLSAGEFIVEIDLVALGIGGVLEQMDSSTGNDVLGQAPDPDDDLNDDDNGTPVVGRGVATLAVTLLCGAEPDKPEDGDGQDSNLTLDFGFTRREQPTGVQLGGLRAEASETAVRLQWWSVDERDVAGYNVFRSSAVDRDYAKVNEGMLVASDDPLGSDYAFDDRPEADGVYYYRIEIVMVDGRSWTQGPVSVAFGETARLHRIHLPILPQRVSFGELPSGGAAEAAR